MFTVMAGSPFDGVKAIRSFTDTNEANEWADANLHGEDWWVIPVPLVEGVVLPVGSTSAALDRIHALLDGTEWSGEVCEQINRILIKVGWPEASDVESADEPKPGEFPLDSEGNLLAWPDPNFPGEYVDAWNGSYGSREEALDESRNWTAVEGERVLAFGEPLRTDSA